MDQLAHSLHEEGQKSSLAFRTISEVSQEIDVPQHVLRFWESRFSQIKPLKRGGGRRYYRPEDIELLRCIQIAQLCRNESGLRCGRESLPIVHGCLQQLSIDFGMSRKGVVNSAIHLVFDRSPLKIAFDAIHQHRQDGVFARLCRKSVESFGQG